MLFFRYTFTENLYSNNIINWLEKNKIEYTVGIEKDKLIFHVQKKDHPLLLDITVSSKGYNVERPGNFLLTNMITKKACKRIINQDYNTIEDLIIDLYRSFQYSRK